MMPGKMDRLKEIVAEAMDLNHVQFLLQWDQQVCMPPGGEEDRSHAMAIIARFLHDKFTNEEIQSLATDVAHKGDIEPGSEDAYLLRSVTREIKKQTRIPARWVEEFALVTTRAHGAWARARHESNFGHFLPFMQKIVEMRGEYASFFAPYDHIYDPLLDDFEPGMKTFDVISVFDAIKPRQIELVQRIQQSRPVEDSFLHRPYSETGQMEFNRSVLSTIGLDWNRCKLDFSAHPFTMSMGTGDVRLTTRFDANNGLSSFFSCVHEGGHALYESGIPRSVSRSLLGRLDAMAAHESQSRLWENLIGRSKPFWKFFFPQLKNLFPIQLEGIHLDQFYKGINKSEPSLIRVESDEATYNLHIFLRMEIEIQLLTGQCRVKDLPELWNAKMREMLGLTPPDDARGVLQDVHWSSGYFGYFPTYALGNVISAQIWDTIRGAFPDIEERIAEGRFDTLLNWLKQHIFSHSAKYSTQELMKISTGSTIKSEHYIQYLENKYSEIYS